MNKGLSNLSKLRRKKSKQNPSTAMKNANNCVVKSKIKKQQQQLRVSAGTRQSINRHVVSNSMEGLRVCGWIDATAGHNKNEDHKNMFMTSIV